ncbi:MAG: 3'-5' exonuclease [Chitinophagaceae bacterium]|nr:3'-5' exonuclease [Chitinophagaceae bacterium]
MQDSILFLDIETVSEYESFDTLPEKWKDLWIHKCKLLDRDQKLSPESLYQERAGIYSEFAKIIVIGLGFFTYTEQKTRQLRVKALYDDGEKDVLAKFSQLLQNRFEENTYLCAHNGKEFDFPFLCRRMLLHSIPLPTCLQMQGKKPWEIKHIDTLDMWKFGDKKNFTSLDTLTTLFGIKTSKTDMDGSQVHSVYYKEKNIVGIAEYCMKDIVALAQVYLRLHNTEILEETDIIFV